MSSRDLVYLEKEASAWALLRMGGVGLAGLSAVREKAGTLETAGFL